jgi:hypothetical protein
MADSFGPLEARHKLVGNHTMKDLVRVAELPSQLDSFFTGLAYFTTPMLTSIFEMCPHSNQQLHEHQKIPRVTASEIAFVAEASAGEHASSQLLHWALITRHPRV